MHSIISTPEAPAAVGPYAQAVVAGNLLFISGQLPVDPQTGNLVAGDVQAQTRQVLQNLQAILGAANLQLTNITMCTCFLKNLEDFAAFNAIYAEVFGTHLPARVCIEAARLPKDALVEITAIAVQ